MKTEPCECEDPGCGECNGLCENVGTVRLFRIDMDDHFGVLFCETCADDCYESGLFSHSVTEINDRAEE